MSVRDAGTRYRVRVIPALHQLQIEADFPAGPQPLALTLPTWLPGAYAFMRYGRDLFDLAAWDGSDGRALKVVREGWAGFRVEGGTGRIGVRYRVTAADPVWGELVGLVGDENAVLLGTHHLFSPTSMGPREVEYLLPEGWELHVPAGGTRMEGTRYRFETHAALVDTPVVAGRFDLRTASLAGVAFHHVHLDRAVGFEQGIDSLSEAFMKVAHGCFDVFGSFPFEHFSFVCSSSPTAHWGLEHATSTTMGLGLHPFIDARARFDAVRLAAHELFHAWNVCRLKPAPLGRLDLVQGGFPDALWVSEGFTRYYEFLLCVRAGEMKPGDFLSNLLCYFRHLEAMPAYARVTAEDSSRATFLNHNRYPGSINNSIDYYDKGMLIAFDLDVELRVAHAPASLDSAFRSFYDAFAGQGEGFTTAHIRDFLEARFPGTGELIRREAEGPGGLTVPGSFKRLGFRVLERTARVLGFVLKDNVGPEVVNVLDTSPAGAAGLCAGDVLLEVNGLAFDLKSLQWSISHGAEVSVRVRRGHAFREFRLIPHEREEISGIEWRGSPVDLGRLRNWLGCPDLTLQQGQRVPLAAFDNFHGIQKVV